MARRRDKSQPQRLALEMNNLLDIVTEDPSFPSRIAASLMFLVLGMQVVAGSVILSVLGIRKRRP